MASAPDKSAYGPILRSSVVLGGARVASMVIGLVRVKVMAVVLAPAGIGLYGTYESILLLIATIFGLGVSRSGVREVARSSGLGAAEAVARVVAALRRIVWILGSAGVIVTTLFAARISRLTFQDTAHSFPIIVLSLTVLIITLTGGYQAIIQGLGRIADLAKQNLYGAIGGTVVSIALIALLGTRGVVPAIVASYLCPLIAAWWFVIRAKLPTVDVGWAETFAGAGPLLKLGLAMMTSALLSSVVAYVARALIVRDLDLAAVGIYVCAFSLSTKFASLIINAMWTDFYPRASSVAHDHSALNRIVNEQTEVALLLGVPGLLATILFAPWMIRILYSSDFTNATVLVRWFTLGCLGGLISGPLRIIQLAKGKSLICFLTETWTSVFHILMILLLLKLWSLQGVAVAYLVHNLMQTAVSVFVARRLTCFTWTAAIRKTFAVLLPVLAGSVFLSLTLPDWIVGVAGIVITGAATVYCARQIIDRLGTEHRVSQWACRFALSRRLLLSHTTE